MSLFVLAVAAVGLGVDAYMDHAEQTRLAREHEERYFRDCEQCPLMARLPAGQFMMGSSKYADHGEGPVHRVDVAEFAAGVYEVTFAEWEACVAAGGCDGYRPDDRAWGRGEASGDPCKLGRRKGVRGLVEPRRPGTATGC